MYAEFTASTILGLFKIYVKIEVDSIPSDFRTDAIAIVKHEFHQYTGVSKEYAIIDELPESAFSIKGIDWAMLARA